MGLGSSKDLSLLWKHRHRHLCSVLYCIVPDLVYVISDYEHFCCSFAPIWKHELTLGSCCTLRSVFSHLFCDDEFKVRLQFTPTEEPREWSVAIGGHGFRLTDRNYNGYATIIWHKKDKTLQFSDDRGDSLTYTHVTEAEFMDSYVYIDVYVPRVSSHSVLMTFSC
jgi:hypothetical protein